MHAMVSWIHFGDLHIAGRVEQNYRDFLSLIDEANCYLSPSIDFALLPGDNTDDGAEDEYQLVQEAISRCRFPVHAITGDHDIAGGSLDPFQKYLSGSLYRSFSVGEYRFLLLNSVAEWHSPGFGLGREQLGWLSNELMMSKRASEHAVVFVHAYPSEHGKDAEQFSNFLRGSNVLLVEMGHTHYNELANDGHSVYAATRSTGQVEEGPPGFSITSLDHSVVSWKFKSIGEWPLVMITSPADERLIIDPQNPAQVLRGEVEVRARAWGNAVKEMVMSIDGGRTIPMEALGESTWSATWKTEFLRNGSHALVVAARTADGQSAFDKIRVLVNQEAKYRPPLHRSTDYDNVVGPWPEKHIFGTQLGPNENGRPWPSRRERERVT